MRNRQKPPIKSKLGQNFLIDSRAQQAIAEALGPAGTGDVLEIGPGKAAITRVLAERARRLVAIEVDPALAAGLCMEFASQPNVEIVASDVLAVSFRELAHGAGRSLAVVGNLPYYITSPILMHLFAEEAVFSRGVLMVQREVADRMTAEPGTSEYGLLSVLCQMHAQLQLLFTLPPSAFQPPPEVDSAVVRLEFAPRWQELGAEPAPFTQFLRSCFAQKRKTLANNLRAAGETNERIEQALGEGRIPRTARSEELSPERLASLYRLLRPSGGRPEQ